MNPKKRPSVGIHKLTERQSKKSLPLDDIALVTDCNVTAKEPLFPSEDISLHSQIINQIKDERKPRKC